MKKQLLILFFFLSFINAQDVEEVVVTSSLTDQTQIDNPVHVVSKEDLANDASVSLGEALDNLLGVSNADFGPAIGQPIIRGMSGSRVKVLSNGMVVRDVSTLGPDHPNNIDLSNAEQVEVVRGPSSLLYSNGTIGGIINVVDNTIAKTDFTGTSGNLSHELQEANDGEVTTFNVQTNQSGLNISFGLSEAIFDSYEIPGGSIIHDDEHEDHEEEGHEEGDMTVLANSDYETSNARFGVSTTGDWGHLGFSLVSREGTNGIPYHGEGHGGHDEHGDEDGDEDHDGDHEDEGHDEHEGERIFADNTSDVFTLEGSYNLNGELVKGIDFFMRSSDYSLTEQHAEEEHHDDEHHDEDEHDEDEHDEHGHEEGPTTFENEATEFGVVLDLSNDSLNQKVAFNFAEEDMSIIGEEAFMNPVNSEEFTVGYYLNTKLGEFDVDFGVRLDDITRNGSVAEEHHDEDEHEGEEEHDEEVELYDLNFSTQSYAVQFSQDWTDNLTVSLALSNVERAPGAQELFMNGPHLVTNRFEVGDVNLGTEVSNNIDFTMNYENDGAFASASFYANAVDNYIYLMDESEADHEDHEDEDHEEHHGDMIRANYLQQDAEFNGYELLVGRTIALPNGSLRVSLGQDSVIGKFNADSADESYVPRLTPKRTFIDVDYSSADYSAGISFKDVKPQYKTAMEESSTEGFMLVDMKVAKEFALSQDVGMTVSFFAKNLMDERARNHTSFVKNQVPLAGRNIGFKFNITF